MKSKTLQLEEEYHDSVSEMYSVRRRRDYIWEVPEELFLLNKRLFEPKTKVVDMGCGPAISVSKILGEPVLHNVSYTGVDVSRKMLKLAKKYIKNGKFVYHDMASVFLPKNKFDILLSLGALHHCENKEHTLEKWLQYVKPGGLLLLREPIYEFLKMGTGESPTEEGIKMDVLFDFIQTRKLRIVRLTFFSTNAFHLFNRIMIKIGLRYWQEVRTLWYPVVYVDAFLAKFSRLDGIFKPQAFAVILQKP